MSGTQVSAWQTPNELLTSMQTPAIVLHNQLANQGAQQELNAAEMEQLSRASNWVLTQQDKPAAYATAVKLLQANNYAKNAPPEYPGDNAMQMLAQQSLTVPQRYQYGITTAPGFDAAVRGATAPLPGQTGAAAPPASSAPGTVAAPGTIEPEAVSRANAVRDGFLKRGLDYDTATAFAANALHESSANPNTGPGDAGKSHGLFQLTGSRYDGYIAKYGHPPDNAPLDEQLDYAMYELNGPELLARDRIMQAQGPEGKAGQVSEAFLRPKDVAAEMARRSATAKQLAALGPAPATSGMTDQQWLANQGRQYPSLAAAGAGTPGQAPAPPGGGVAARYPGAVQAAGPAAGAPPAAPAVAAPAAPPLAQSQVAAAPSPTQGAMQPPPAGGVGFNSPQYQQAQELLRRANVLDATPDPTGRLKSLAAGLRDQAGLIMKVDTFEDLGGGMQRSRLTGEFKYGGPPTARSTTDNDGNTWVLEPGQPPRILHANVSGVTGTGEDASAQRTINELGPLIAKGGGDAQQRANYASAMEVYRKPTFLENANTGERIKVYTRDLPQGFPAPGGAGASGAAGSQTVIPGMSPAQKSAEGKLGEDFATTEKKSYDSAYSTMAMLASANHAAELLNRTPNGFTATGSGATARMEVGKALNTASAMLGGQPFVDPENVGAWEALNKQTKLMGMQVVNSYFGGSREAASIINGATSAVPSAENTYLGFRMVSSGIEQTLQRERDKYEFKAQQLAAGKPLATVDVAFNATHPPEVYTTRAIANAVPDEAVKVLQAQPDTVAAFNKHFGNGVGEFILKGGRTSMVGAG